MLFMETFKSKSLYNAVLHRVLLTMILVQQRSSLERIYTGRNFIRREKMWVLTPFDHLISQKCSELQQIKD